MAGDAAFGIGKKKLVDLVIQTNYPYMNVNVEKFTYPQLLFIIQEFLYEEGKQYYEKSTFSHLGLDTFRAFVKHCLYRNIANYDTMLLVEGKKGSGKSSAGMMLAKEWCRLLGIRFAPERHIAYSNADMMRKIDTLEKFEPLLCLASKTTLLIKENDGKIKREIIRNLKNRKDFEVVSYNQEKNIFEWSKHDGCVKTSDSKICYEIKLENGQTIKATENHKFLLKSGEYKTLKDLQLGDELVLISSFCAYCKKEFVPLRSNWNCCSKTCLRRYKKKIYTTKKVCPICEKEFITKSFSKKQVYCSLNCHSKHKIKYLKKYREENKQILKENVKKKHNENPEYYKTLKKEDRKKHKEKYNKKCREWYVKNKEYSAAQSKKYRERHKEEFKEYKKKQHIKYMLIKPEYKVIRNLRRRVKLALEDKDATKHKRTLEYLDCDIFFFMDYISSKFTEGMTWKNYGKLWHLDHIKACATFKILDEEEQKKAFHYTNYQPLWAIDNLRKGIR